MRCPTCESETAYLPPSQRLVCLSDHCNWTMELTEDGVFDLFFGSKTPDPELVAAR
jgi:hypothetical protein